jgi:hypothetical protein
VLLQATSFEAAATWARRLVLPSLPFLHLLPARLHLAARRRARGMASSR